MVDPNITNVWNIRLIARARIRYVSPETHRQTDQFE